MSVSLKWVIVLAFVMAASLQPSLAQTDPPPPGKTTAAPKSTAPAPGAEPAGEPAVTAPQPEAATPPPPSAAEGVMKDIEDQQSVDEIEKRLELIRQMVRNARQSAQNFRLARAELSDIIASGKCAGIAGVLAKLDRQEADTRTLVASLDESCAGAKAGSALLATCTDERKKLDAELAGYAEDKTAVRNMCPKSGQ